MKRNDMEEHFINPQASNMDDLNDYDLACFLFAYNAGCLLSEFLADARMIHRLAKLTDEQRAELIRRAYLAYQNGKRLLIDYYKK